MVNCKTSINQLSFISSCFIDLMKLLLLLSLFRLRNMIHFFISFFRFTWCIINFFVFFFRWVHIMFLLCYCMEKSFGMNTAYILPLYNLTQKIKIVHTSWKNDLKHTYVIWMRGISQLSNKFFAFSKWQYPVKNVSSSSPWLKKY